MVTVENVQYDIYKLEDLENKVIPFFEKYKLRGSKNADFKLWKEAVTIIGVEKQRRRQKITRPATLVNFNEDELSKLQKIKRELMELHGVTKLGLPKGRPRKPI